MDAAQQITEAKQRSLANLTNAGKGRPKGVPNKNTAIVKDMVIQALTKAGGAEYLEKQAKQNPNAFLTLVGKVIPLQLHGAGDEGEHVHTILIKGVPS